MTEKGLERGLGRGQEAKRNQNRHPEFAFGHLGRPEANEGVKAFFWHPEPGPRRG